MDLWQMIANDQANATDLCRGVIGAIGPGIGGRKQLFDQLQAELERHMAAERDTIFSALEKQASTRRLVGELRNEQAAIEAGLERLATDGNMDDRDWTQRFEDFSYLLDQHFYRVQHELVPAARRAVSPGEERRLQHAFARHKLAALRAERRGGWMSAGMVLGTLAGAAAVALAAVVWRNSSFRESRSSNRHRQAAASHLDQDRRPPLAREPRGDERRLHVM